MWQGVKILVEIDGLHDQYLSQQELFLQSAAASERSMVDGDTSMDGNDTSTVDSGTLRVGGDTSTVDGCIVMLHPDDWWQHSDDRRQHPDCLPTTALRCSAVAPGRRPRLKGSAADGTP
jgi:hypothetical protein